MPTAKEIAWPCLSPCSLVVALERTVRVRLEASVGDIPRLFPVFDANEPNSFGKCEQSAFNSNPKDRAGAPFMGLTGALGRRPMIRPSPSRGVSRQPTIHHSTRIHRWESREVPRKIGSRVPTRLLF